MADITSSVTQPSCCNSCYKQTLKCCYV